MWRQRGGGLHRDQAIREGFPKEASAELGLEGWMNIQPGEEVEKEGSRQREKCVGRSGGAAASRNTRSEREKGEERGWRGEWEQLSRGLISPAERV